MHAYSVCPLLPAPQPCWAAQHSFRSAYVVFLTLGTRGFLRVRGGGGITTLGILRMLSKRPVPVCQNGLHLRLWSDVGTHTSLPPKNHTQRLTR